MSRARKSSEASIVRCSAAECLTFVAAGGSAEDAVELRYEDENVWLTQKMMAALCDVTVPAIDQHLKRIFADSELGEAAVVKQCSIAAADGKNCLTKHYRLQALVLASFLRLSVPEPRGDVHLLRVRLVHDNAGLIPHPRPPWPVPLRTGADH